MTIAIHSDREQSDSVKLEATRARVAVPVTAGAQRRTRCSYSCAVRCAANGMQCRERIRNMWWPRPQFGVQRDCSMNRRCEPGFELNKRCLSSLLSVEGLSIGRGVCVHARGCLAVSRREESILNVQRAHDCHGVIDELAAGTARNIRRPLALRHVRRAIEQVRRLPLRVEEELGALDRRDCAVRAVLERDDTGVGLHERRERGPRHEVAREGVGADGAPAAVGEDLEVDGVKQRVPVPARVAVPRDATHIGGQE